MTGVSGCMAPYRTLSRQMAGGLSGSMCSAPAMVLPLSTAVPIALLRERKKSCVTVMLRASSATRSDPSSVVPVRSSRPWMWASVKST